MKCIVCLLMYISRILWSKPEAHGWHRGVNESCGLRTTVTQALKDLQPRDFHLREPHHYKPTTDNIQQIRRKISQRDYCKDFNMYDRSRVLLAFFIWVSFKYLGARENSMVRDQWQGGNYLCWGQLRTDYEIVQRENCRQHLRSTQEIEWCTCSTVPEHSLSER